MKLRLFLPLAVCLAVLPVFSSAASAAPPSALGSIIRGVIAAANANNAAKVGSYFEPESIVIDAFPPYVWKGTNAGGRWWGDVATYDSAHHTTLRATVGTIDVVNVSMDDAYVVVPLTITLEAHGKRHRQTGLWALTLRRTGGIWRISTAAWATGTP